MASDIVERLRSPEVFITTGGMVSPVAEEAAAEIEKLRAALQPLAKLFLFPDDLGFEAALDIKSDQDWDDDANDMQTEGVFILRRYIRAARAALGEKG
jgi:hypothetical protein